MSQLGVYLEALIYFIFYPTNFPPPSPVYHFLELIFYQTYVILHVPLDPCDDILFGIYVVWHILKNHTKVSVFLLYKWLFFWHIFWCHIHELVVDVVKIVRTVWLIQFLKCLDEMFVYVFVGKQLFTTFGKSDLNNDNWLTTFVRQNT